MRYTTLHLTQRNSHKKAITVLCAGIICYGLVIQIKAYIIDGFSGISVYGTNDRLACNKNTPNIGIMSNLLQGFGMKLL